MVFMVLNNKEKEAAVGLWHSPEVRERRRYVFIMLLFLLLLIVGSGFGGNSWLTDEVFRWVGNKYGEKARLRVVEWKDLMTSDNSGADREKLKRVNDFFNKLSFHNDQILWGKEDYWATPLEALGRGGADCEDYSIAKYFSLREMGVPDVRLRIMYVKALELNQAHMVLAYYASDNAVPLLLDNINGKILPATERMDLVPVYSFNTEGLWQAKNRGGRKLGTSKSLGMWQDLKARMAEDLKKSLVTSR